MGTERRQRKEDQQQRLAVTVREVFCLLMSINMGWWLKVNPKFKLFIQTKMVNTRIAIIIY